jgi:hypothetical protein
MKFSSWLNALKAGPARRPIRRNESRLSRRNSMIGKLSVENLEARTVPAFLAPVDYAIGTYSSAVITGDFNGDSVTDLATANYSANQISVLLGNPDGTFQAAVNTSPANWPTSLAVGDFNEDGKLDLASANSSGVSIHLGNGNGSFQAVSQVLSDSSTSSVAVGDFDADGNLDLASTSSYFVIDGYYWGYYGGYYPFGHYEGQANVLLGNADGTFDAVQSTGLGYGSHTGAIAADFNGDGKDDLAAVDGSNLLKVALANSDGSLQAPASYGTDWSPHSVAVGDVNSDGINDLVTANYYGLSVLVGNGAGGTGDGTFQAAKNVATGYYASSVATGDFNDDGNLDLAASVNRWVIDYWGYWGYYGHYESDTQVLLGYDNGHFAAPDTTFVGLGWSPGIVSGDFDDDGFTDVALTNSDYGKLSVLINDEGWLPLPPPAVSVNDVTIDEGNSGSTSATFTLSLPFAHTQNVTVHYETANGTASSGSDYTGLSGNVTFLAGQTSKEINVAILGDRAGEPNESFTLNLSTVDGLIGDGVGIATIVDDEPQITIDDASATEVTNGTSNATFTVTLSRLYDEDVTVQYATASGSAAAGSDFTGVTNGSVTIPEGSLSRTFAITVLDDRLGESSESFAVNLSGAANALFSDSSGAGTINDNEPRMWIDDVVKHEGNGQGKNKTTTQFVFTVHLSDAYDVPVTVNFSTANGSATVAGNDYIARSGSLTFAAGETSKTVIVEVKADKSRESDEWFALNLTSASTNVLMLDSEGLGWILDDDRRGKG